MVCVLTAYLTGFADFIGNFIFSHKTMSLESTSSRRKKMTGKDHIRNRKNAFIVKRKRKKIIKIL